jgi:hypothetical protein
MLFYLKIQIFVKNVIKVVWDMDVKIMIYMIVSNVQKIFLFMTNNLRNKFIDFMSHPKSV